MQIYIHLFQGLYALVLIFGAVFVATFVPETKAGLQEGNGTNPVLQRAVNMQTKADLGPESQEQSGDTVCRRQGACQPTTPQAYID